ncbi:hypothetical protein CNR22_13220 [Sphingobacteriaceae bacterium]|nr:hypothetical protein CNR22_13220 [Sphingobacteriaceae bacterium]
MKKLVYIVLFFFTVSARAQVLSYDFYSFRINNMFNVNPAYAGKEDGFDITLSAQTQNKGVSYANKNYMFGIDAKISKKQALGLKVISDSRGAFQVLKTDLSYAYIAKLANDSKFTLGLSGGLLNNSLMVNRIENFQSLDQSDPTLTKSYYNTNQFVAGAGFLYTFKDLEVSFSMPHIISTNQPLNGYVNAAVFYTLKTKNEQFKFTPWICYQNIPVTKDLASVFLKSMYDDKVWVQLGYQTNKSFCAMFGVTVENLNIGYGYKTSNREFNAVTSGLHEITFILKIKDWHGIGHVF